MKKIWIALASVGALLSAGPALAVGQHETRSQLRPYVAGNVYLGQQVQAAVSQFSLTEGDTSLENLRMGGVALKTSLGVEHLRCLQTGVFYVNLNQSNSARGLRELMGHEFGAEVKLSLNSPLVNVGVGGGGFYSSARFRGAANDAVSLAGTGGYGIVELTYYVSERVSLMFSGTQAVTQYRKSNLDASDLRGKGNSTRLGAGLAVWL